MPRPSRVAVAAATLGWSEKSVWLCLEAAGVEVVARHRYK